MTPIVVGIDIDGVLADFDRSMAMLLEEFTPVVRNPGLKPAKCWDYTVAPPAGYGYLPEEVSQAWEAIRASHDFWLRLPPMEGAQEFLSHLANLAEDGDVEPYFLTARSLGVKAKEQTESWLMRNGYFTQPTVLIARGPKGMVARGVGFDFFLDDRPSNCVDVRLHGKPGSMVGLFLQDHNRDERDACQKLGIPLVPALQEFTSWVVAAL